MTRGLRADEEMGPCTRVLGNVGIIFLEVFQLPLCEMSIWGRD